MALALDPSKIAALAQAKDDASYRAELEAILVAMEVSDDARGAVRQTLATLPRPGGRVDAPRDPLPAIVHMDYWIG